MNKFLHLIKTKGMKQFFTMAAMCGFFTAHAQKVSFSAGLGIFRESHESTRQLDDPEHRGTSVIAELHAAKNRHLMSVSFIYGVEFVLLSDAAVSFTEMNAMYGRYFPVNHVFQIEGLAGIGYFNIKDPRFYETDYYGNGYDAPYLRTSRVAFPLRVNFRFFPDSRFGFGIKTNYNINSFSKVLSGQLYGTFTF